MPRQCGIATFTGDLACYLSDTGGNVVVDCIAMSDRQDYDYPDAVKFAINDSEPEDYARAAAFLNQAGYDLLSVQHEYGIFGGEAGSHLMGLVRAVKMPIVTTLHTVLMDPSPAQRAVLGELLELSERVVVMSERAVMLLIEVHGISRSKIDLIPHGIPAIPQGSGTARRNSLAIPGPMILTFGLLSPDKGIQYVIEAMPKILEFAPGATYMVVGATHPHVRATSGESYRESLQARAVELGVSNKVRFVDSFVSIEDLVEFLDAMDVYVTPYLNVKQITSGTLAYSVGAGKPVISTPYWYAEEVLADGRGILVPFRDSDAIVQAILSLQRSPSMREDMGARAAEFGSKMLWPEVALQYISSFDRARLDSLLRLPEMLRPAPDALRMPLAVPTLCLDHLKNLSDDTGILQHATHSIPNRDEGYCVDDNARALLLTAGLESQGPLSRDLRAMQGRYLAFVLHAFNPTEGRFRNFMGYDRSWLESVGSEDSQGRTVWALGGVVRGCRDLDRRAVALELFDRSSQALLATTSPRTWAYGALGAAEYLASVPDNEAARTLLTILSGRLLTSLQANQSPDWPWFEQSLSYANARLPQALIVAGATLNEPEMASAGLNSLRWLMTLQTGYKGLFNPIGTSGLAIGYRERDYFDQQPIEAASAVSACMSALRAEPGAEWRNHASRSFRWFLGENLIGKPLYDPLHGACNDGLHSDRVNRNQGAESTLSYLGAWLEMSELATQPSAGLARRSVA